MLNMKFAIRNPFTKEIDGWAGVCKDIPVSNHKFFEFQFNRMSPYDLFSVMVDLSWRGHDHAGPRLEIEVYGWFFHVSLYDNRHWDYEKGTWEKYDASL